MNWYSQNHEDKWIAENLGHLLPEKGFYVDIGCAHPFETSNTAFLRDRKWEGLAIDGNLGWSHMWEDIPAFHSAVITTKPKEDTYFLNAEVGWHSRIDPEGKWTEAETIEQLLERFGVGKIDFLSIDTEGTEFDILQSFDFDKHNPQIVIAEYNAQHKPIVAPEDSPILPLMIHEGYRLMHTFSPINMIFAK